MKKKSKKPQKEISSTPVVDQPVTVYELINKYGTYEIQPTCDTENQYPTIAQGFNKKIINNNCENKSAE